MSKKPHKPNSEESSILSDSAQQMDIKDPKERSAFEKDLYYNYFTEPDEYPMDEINSTLHLQDDKAWMHLTCGFWLPEVSFNACRTRIFNLENIDKRRFHMKCEICKKKNAGACVQCPVENCTQAFHPECARRAG